MQSLAQTGFTFQPFSSEFTRDPNAVYARMRNDCPIYYFKDWDAYLLSTYTDISTLVNDPRLLRTPDPLLPEDEVAQRRHKENWQDTPSLSRYDPPLPYFHRFIGEDMEYKGQKFTKGTKIGVLYASANRDPLQFPEPDRFDVTREPNRHLAFGIGAHFCLGNHLARLNMDIMFSSILRRIPDIQLATDHLEFRTGITSRGLKALPVCW